MSDDKQGASEGQASPPAGERVTEEMVGRARKAFVRSAQPHFVGCSERHMRAAIEAALSHAGGSVGLEQADVAVLPEAEAERLRRIEAAIKDVPGMLSVADVYRDNAKLRRSLEVSGAEVERLRAIERAHGRLVQATMLALRAALSEGERHG